jgi:hypothetical protein
VSGDGSLLRHGHELGGRDTDTDTERETERTRISQGSLPRGKIKAPVSSTHLCVMRLVYFIAPFYILVPPPRTKPHGDCPPPVMQGTATAAAGSPLGCPGKLFFL